VTILAFCIGYITPSHFPNLQKRFLSAGSVLLLKHVPVVYGHIFSIISW